MSSLRDDNSISVCSVVSGTNARMKDPYRIENIDVRSLPECYCTN